MGFMDNIKNFMSVNDGLDEEEKEAIAMAFVNESGWHPWDK